MLSVMSKTQYFADSSRCVHEVVDARAAFVYNPYTMIPKTYPATATANATASAATESPCIKVCLLDQEQRCRGCGRTVDEITRWRDMTSAERIAINQRVGFVSHERGA